MGRTYVVELDEGRYWHPDTEWNERSYIDRVKNYISVSKGVAGFSSNVRPSGNVYGSVTLDGNATAHLGDVHHHYLKDVEIRELLNAGQTGIVRTLQLAVQIASRLAFTDWHHSVQMLSMSVLDPGFDVEDMPDKTQFEGLFIQVVAMCFDGIGSAILDKRLFVDDWVALDLDGFVVSRPAAWTTDISTIRGKLISFANGKIMFEGSQYKKVRNDRAELTTGISAIDDGQRINTYLASTDHTVHQGGVLHNKFSNIRIRPLLSPLGDTIFVRTELYLNESTPMLIDSTKAASALYHLLISDPCSHGYSDRYSIKSLCQNQSILEHCSAVYTLQIVGTMVWC